MTGRVRIAVVRALHGLGDMLCAVPAFAALREAHPEAHVTWIGLPSCRWMLDRFGALIDSWVPFPGFPGIPEQPFAKDALLRFIGAARAAPFDLAIQMHGSGSVSNRFTVLLGARATAGLYASPPPPSGQFFPYPQHGSEVHRCLFLTRSLGCPSDDDRLYFPVGDSDRTALAANDRLSAAAVREPFVCVHPGARDHARRWPPDRFAKVADALAELGFHVVLTGTAAEHDACAKVAASMQKPALNVAGCTTLGVAAALLERAALLITNDTGISHLAAALGTPSVIVFLASDPERWAPLDGTRHRPVVARRLGARTESDRMQLARGDLPGVHEVLDEAFDLLSAAHDQQRRA